MQEINIGDVVVSVAGRDMGEFYFVFKTDENYVYVVNGKTKTTLKPKLKKIKHIRPTGQNSTDLKQKWQQGIKVLDSEVRNTIKLYELRSENV